jgi:hypothetical protein
MKKKKKKKIGWHTCVARSHLQFVAAAIETKVQFASTLFVCAWSRMGMVLMCVGISGC